MKMFFKRLWRSWFPQHTLFVTHRKKDYVIQVKQFKKLSAKRITGWNVDGKYFELISQEPMDYFIEEYKDDLK